MQERLLKSYNTLYEKNPYGYLITTIAKSLKVSRQCIGEALNTIRDKGFKVLERQKCSEIISNFVCMICGKEKSEIEKLPNRHNVCKDCEGLYRCPTCKKVIKIEAGRRNFRYCKECASKLSCAYLKKLRLEGGERWEKYRKIRNDNVKAFYKRLEEKKE
jgi:DNA-directed RNA polymerase subunit RPC12/RpoP